MGINKQILLIIAHSRVTGAKRERQKNHDDCHIFIHKNRNRKFVSRMFCVYNMRFSNILHYIREIDNHIILNILNRV